MDSPRTAAGPCHGPSCQAGDPSAGRRRYGRRAVLAGICGGAAAVFGASGARAAAEGANTPQTVIVPAVSEFEDGYEGQFLQITEPTDDEAIDPSPSDVNQNCDVPWPDDNTSANVGQLTDRRSDAPLAVELPVYMNSEETDIVEDALFVISNAIPCEGQFVRLELSWITTRSLVGGDPGPVAADDGAGAGGGQAGADGGQAGVAETEGGDGPGFGLVGGALGVGGVLLARWLRGGSDPGE